VLVISAIVVVALVAFYLQSYDVVLVLRASAPHH
jgi:hypothetical protein